MKEYHTKQMDILLNFFENHPDCQYSVSEAAENLKDQKLGKSTIYRLISRLEKKGQLKRFSKDGSKTFVYQYANYNKCESHLHLKCMECGKLIHLEEQFSDELQEKVFKDSQFEIDEGKTLLFGKCNICRKTGK